ncbi:Hypothetical predicted protein [Cloeon dipterum]|uniref:Uncharacterized protein n=1 Tax=Cloeon dipterum TaxID=197152 RepID=A0A8S1DCH0_9INSE|nr:Hypothetical predicted protein [Cloeon dipterum]
MAHGKCCAEVLKKERAEVQPTQQQTILRERASKISLHSTIFGVVAAAEPQGGAAVSGRSCCSLHQQTK